MCRSRSLFYLRYFSKRTPVRRFQNPAEFLHAMAPTMNAVDVRRRIARQSIQKASLPIRVPELASREQDLHRRRFP